MLSDIKVKSAKSKKKPYKLNDGQGLFLQIAVNGGKWWRFKYRFDNKEKLISLGTYPEISLVDARERRDEARKQVAIQQANTASRQSEQPSCLSLCHICEKDASEMVSYGKRFWDGDVRKRNSQRRAA